MPMQRSKSLIGELLDEVAVAHALVAQNVAVVPEVLDDGWSSFFSSSRFDSDGSALLIVSLLADSYLAIPINKNIASNTEDFPELFFPTRRLI